MGTHALRGGLLSAALVPLLAACGRDDRAEIRALLARARQAPVRTVSDADVARLPDPVQRVLRKAGVVGRPRPRAFRMRGTGLLQREGRTDFDEVTWEQYNTFPEFTRNWLMRGSLALVVRCSGRDSYEAGAARMAIRLFGVPFQETVGPELSRSGLVTVLAEIGKAPENLVDERLSWRALDEHRAEVTLSDHGLTVRGVLRVDADGNIVAFDSEDRYGRFDGRWERRPWTGESAEPRELRGRSVATRMKGLWHDERGPRLYGDLRVTDLEYDVFELYDSAAP